MKMPGMVRKLDSLGRVVIPLEIRQAMGVQGGDQLEMQLEDGMLLLRKFEPGCIFCRQSDGLVTFEGKNICSTCLRKIRRESV